ncbi:AAEL002439-PA [Aedes aegypti]|uniref:AAEL002439-PA n=1 Tax=Aedes aegypti TaxID=7159 RepID=Q17I58_AEDAE|nr:AAEL002439-PA [Aedes aegypti]
MKTLCTTLIVVSLLANFSKSVPLKRDDRRRILSAETSSIPSDVQLVSFENDHNSPDSYQFNYALSDDQTRDEVGTLKDGKDEDGNDVRFFVVRGSYSFTGDDGQTYWVHYTADETGYHPQVGTGPDPGKTF